MNFISLEGLRIFLENCKGYFANVLHKHTLNDITDYKVDTELSAESTNSVQNKVINEEFQAVSEGMLALDAAIDTKADKTEIPTKVSQLENDSDYTSVEQVHALYQKLNSNTVLGFYCIEDVTIVTNGISTVYPANSNVEVKLLEDDVFEIIPTSNNSILTLTAFPGALSTFYPWLEGVKQFSNILFDMNGEDMYTKWNQGNQGAYQVQYAQYLNCIFWSDNAYISELSKRTNYTLYYSSQLPLCYSTIPDNTFKAFYLAFGVNSDPNWGNIAYRDSFAKATYATQVFSYYGARTIGIYGHDDPDFNIVLPKDCRGLMSAATAIENAGTFDAINTTNFGAKSGSWRDAFGWCESLRSLYIKNLKVNLNVSWSPLNYDSIYFIISEAANTNKITISLSPYTYNLLGPSDFELAASKNITIECLTTNYVEDRRLGTIVNKADKTYVDEQISELNQKFVVSDWNQNDENALDYIKNRTHWIEENAGEVLYHTLDEKFIPDTIARTSDIQEVNTSLDVKKEKDLIVTYKNGSSSIATHYVSEILDAVNNGRTVMFQKTGELLHLLEVTPDFATFYIIYLNMNNKVQQKVVALSSNSIILEQDDTYDYATTNALKSYYSKTEVDKKIADLVNSAPDTLDTLGELATAFQENKDVVDAINQSIVNKANSAEVLFKTEQTLTDEEKAQVRQNLRFIGKNVAGQEFTIDGVTKVAQDNAEIFGDYDNNIAIGSWSIAEGSETKAIGRASHAEGALSQAVADGSHAEGYNTKATGYWSHAEGEMTLVTSYASHAEGSYCTMPDGSKRYSTASGYASHTEGGGCHTTGSCAHAEGLGTTASGNQSHVEGRYTIAAGSAQHVEGAANIEDTENRYLHIAGNGTSPTDRSNAHTLDWDGNAEYAGDVIAQGCGNENPISLITLNSTVQSLVESTEEYEYLTNDDIAALFV